MSFGAKESGLATGRPYRLYKITAGGRTWGYTTLRSAVQFGGLTYVPATCEDDGDKAMTDTESGEVKIRLAHDLPICTLLKTRPPSTAVTVEIFKGHVGDPHHARMWAGRTLNFEIKYPTAELLTESILSSMRRMAATLVISSRCSVPLYGDVCRVDKEAHRLDGVVATLSGLTVGISGLSAVPNYYAGGEIRWLDSNYDVDSVRDIESSGSGVLVLSTQPLGLQVGQAVKVYPGCNHEWGTDCRTKFNNTINCPAFVGMNGRNPFAGYSVF